MEKSKLVRAISSGFLVLGLLGAINNTYEYKSTQDRIFELRQKISELPRDYSLREELSRAKLKKQRLDYFLLGYFAIGGIGLMGILSYKNKD